MFDAVVTAGNLLQTFQVKGLRKVLRLRTAFVQRVSTQEYLYKRASEVLGAPTEGEDRKITPFREVLAQNDCETMVLSAVQACLDLMMLPFGALERQASVGLPTVRAVQLSGFGPWDLRFFADAA